MARMPNLLTTRSAAAALGFSQDYIRRLCITGRLPSQKLGNDWLIYEKDLKKIKRQRFRRRKKEEIENGSGK